MANRDRRGANRPRNQQKTNTFKRKVRGGIGPKVSDARQRILSKKRKGVLDARDVLAKMARTQDARDRILRIRESKKGGKAAASGSVRAIGSNILKKTDRNGKISLVTGRNKQGSTSDMNLAIQQQLGLVAQVRKKMPTPAKERRRSPQRSRKSVLPEFAPPSLPMLLEAYNDYFSPLRRPVRRQPQGWTLPAAQPTPRGYIDLDAPEDEEMPLVAVTPAKQTIVMHGTSRSSNVHSRLDTSPAHGYSHGIFATPTKTKVVVPTGHRIVVSNLQDGVTEDDIRELFEDIGQLLVARLVRPGTAEVIYKNLKDAQRAVDTYHNRQLDGQPMKCLLVNKRPFNNPIAPAISVSKLSNSSLSRSSTKKLPQSKPVSEKLVPDLETIHKVLFQRN